MSAPKFTPGPWFIATPSNAGGNGTQVWARGGDVRVANCDSGGICLEGRRSDARLIAAAPELYEALHEAEQMLSALLKHLDANLPNGARMAALDVARAALKKARGEAA